LVLILQEVGNDPPDGSNQANNEAKTYPGLKPDEALGSIHSSGPKLQIVVYASSRTNVNIQPDPRLLFEKDFVWPLGAFVDIPVEGFIPKV
jgi:hypothetical protein